MSYSYRIQENRYSDWGYANYSNRSNHKDFSGFRKRVNLKWSSNWDKSKTALVAGQGDTPNEGEVTEATVQPELKPGVAKFAAIYDIQRNIDLVASRFPSIPEVQGNNTKIKRGDRIEANAVFMKLANIQPGDIMKDGDLDSSVSQLQTLAKYSDYANYAKSSIAATYSKGRYANYSKYGQNYTSPNSAGYSRSITHKNYGQWALNHRIGYYRWAGYAKWKSYGRRWYGKWPSFYGQGSWRRVYSYFRAWGSYQRYYYSKGAAWYSRQHRNYSQGYANHWHGERTFAYSNARVDYGNVKG